MTNDNIIRMVAKLSTEQREHLASLVTLSVATARLLDKPINTHKLTTLRQAINGQATRHYHHVNGKCTTIRQGVR
jgi:hypothetical protein